MIDSLSGWLSHPWLNWSVGIFSVVAVLATFVLVPRFLAKLPPDYLQNPEASKSERPSLLWRVLRNVLGVLLVLMGVAMLLLPGQGLLTLLVGVLLVDFPGKQAFVVRLLRRPKVLKIVNKLRARHGAPPMT